jgi:hypothetical protein
LLQLLENFDDPLPNDLAVVARLDTEVADETPVFQALPVEDFVGSIEKGAEALKRGK